MSYQPLVTFCVVVLSVFSILGNAISGNASAAEPTSVHVCRDAGAGNYEAFPDVCRLQDGRLMCVFYASYHPNGLSRLQNTERFRAWIHRAALQPGRMQNMEYPVIIDSLVAAYPSMFDLNDGSTLIVYYEEGGQSNIRAKRFCAAPTGIKWVAL